MKNLFIFCFILLLSGCVSYEYSGEVSVPTEKVTIYANAESVPEKYSVLGTALVSGEYQNVSRQMLLEKLQQEAKKSGADAVIITEDKVLPGKSQGGQPLYDTAFDYDDMQRSWRQLYRDVNINFAGKEQTSTLTSYERIIKAKFVKFVEKE